VTRSRALAETIGKHCAKQPPEYWQNTLDVPNAQFALENMFCFMSAFQFMISDGG